MRTTFNKACLIKSASARTGSGSLLSLGLNLHPLLGSFWRCQQGNVLDRSSQVEIDQPQFYRAIEVHQHLHHPVEAMNLTSNDVQVAPRVRIDLAHFLAQ